MKILVSDSISQKGIEILKKTGLEVDVRAGMKPDELKACIGEYHGLVVRSDTKVTAEIIEAAKNLKVIGRAGSGLDNVDKAAATKKGIVVMNTPGGNTVTTAEHAIALMFAMARQIPQATASLKAGKWEKKRFMGVELYNKTLGIIGIGNIGKEVAKRTLALGMNVIGYDPYLSEESAGEIGIKKVGLPEIFKNSDFITIHTPMTAETRNLVNKDTINAMKEGVRLINCARGGIINEADLAEGLKSSKVAGAALDVFEKEPPGENPLLALDNVVCTPHLGASTEDAQENVAIAIAEQIADYLSTGVIRNAVNFPSIPADQAPKLQPYLTLAERLGGFASQTIDGAVTEITIEYRGDASELDTSAVTIASLKGFLAPILEETVNFVNAPGIARDRGIVIKETKTANAGDYQSMIVLRLTADGKETRIYGTLLSRKDPRIVRINNFPVEIVPEGTMLHIYNNDRPGVIGNIGSYLAKFNINIARMHFGRDTAGGLAISVVNIDAPLTHDQLEEIRKMPNILSVKVVNL